MRFFEFEYRAPLRSAGTTVSFPDVPDHVANVVRRSSTFYEADLLEHLFCCAPRKGIYVDVGAHFGNHSLYFAKYLASFVVSLEPHPDTFETLRETLEKNEIRNAVCLNTAAGNSRSTGRLSLSAQHAENVGAYSLCAQGGGKGGVDVSVDSVDSIVGRLGLRRVNLLKVDVEGYEQVVLEGAIRTLEKDRPHIVIEVLEDVEFRRISDRLERLGYHCLGRFCASPTYHFAPWSRARRLLWRLKRKCISYTQRHQSSPLARALAPPLRRLLR